MLFSRVYVEQGRRYETFGRRHPSNKMAAARQMWKTCRDAPLFGAADGFFIRFGRFLGFREHIFGLFQISFILQGFHSIVVVLWNAAHFLWPSPLAGRKSAQNEETSRFCRSSLNQSTEAICRGVKCRDFRWVAALGFVKALNGLTSLLRNQHTAE